MYFQNLPRIVRGALFLLLSLALMLGTLSAPAQIKAEPDRPEVTILPNRIMMPPQCRCLVQLQDYQVKTRIQDNIATTTITQRFQNNSAQTLEARYLFPLPADANFSSFTLTVNGKALEGRILEKNQARQTYQDIVRKLIDPGLLEYIDDQTVQVSIAPFFAGETKTIQLSYSQVLKQDGGLYKYNYHLGESQTGTLGSGIPRPIPLHPQTEDQTGKTLPSNSTPFNITVDLGTSQPLKTIYSPSHSPKIDRQTDRKAEIQLKLSPAELKKERNFVLYFSESNQALGFNTLNFQKPGEDGYFLATLRAPQSLSNQKSLPKDIVLVLDTSGSMSGDKIKQAKAALKAIIEKLKPEDQFGLLQFNTDVSSFKTEPVPATADNKKAALAYIENLAADGSTNIGDALSSAFAQLQNHNAQRPAYVIFLTDGQPTVGVTDTDGLLKIARKANQVNAHLFNFGVGYDINTLLLGKLAEDQHGSTTYVEPEEDLELAITSFYGKIDSPVLTDIKLDYGNLQVNRVYPDKIGDLFAGSEIVLLGRYHQGGSSTIQLSGKAGNETKTFTFPVQWSASTEHSYLPRLWGGRRIAYLLENIRQHGENDELKSEVIALSKQYGIITPYTSYLATEPDDYRRPAGSPMPSAPFLNQAAMDASSGAGAVKFSKSLNQMKAQASVSQLSAAEGVDQEATDATIKTIGQKTFVRSPQNVWVDSAYDEKAGKPITKVAFGSEAYFNLLKQKPELVLYFSIAEQVMVVLEGTVYQVTAP